MWTYVKSLEPAALNVDPDQTSQTLAEVRRTEEAALEKNGKARKRGPMRPAFFTRKPPVPRESLVPKGLRHVVAPGDGGVGVGRVAVSGPPRGWWLPGKVTGGPVRGRVGRVSVNADWTFAAGAAA